MASYSYILSDFPNNKYNSDTLSDEIVASSILSTLDRIDGTATGCAIFFLTDLSSPDQTTLDTVVANHTGEAAEDAGDQVVEGALFIKPVDAPVSTSYTLAALDASGQIVNPQVAPSYYGQNFQLDSSTSLDTTSSTSPLTKVTMVSEDLPPGLYKITAGWVGSYTNDKNQAMFDVTLNGTPLGTRPEVAYTGPKDGNTIMVFDRRFYENLSGVNTILLRYWSSNALYSTTISDAYIELIRIS